jgi:hypothetical protein
MREVKALRIPGTEERIGDTIIHSGEEWRVEEYDTGGRRPALQW